MQSRLKLLYILLVAGIPFTGTQANSNEFSLHVATAQQQAHIVKGTVTDPSGDPLIGVSIQVKGETEGTVTDLDGNYQISVKKPSATLIFSYVGFATQEIAVNGRKVVNVTLEEGGQLIEEVVVTALGIKRSEKALSYNVQKVGAENVTTVKNANFMNSLAGKVAGVNINASAAGMGGATRVVMRGPKSINQSNQALYVIDGVPINNTSAGEVEGIFSTQPGSEGISDLNPEDIESISVLSGPAAAALYGSAAAQGVIMITTKKGQTGKVQVSISNSTQFSTPFIAPKFQNSYVNRPGEVMSWGNKEASAYGDFDPMNFFNTGSNVQNNVSLTIGSDKNQSYVSVGSTNASGIITNSGYDRYNATFRNTTSFLNDKMTLDFGLNYIKEKDQNLMAQGQYFNPLIPLYLFPRGESFDAIRTYEVYDPGRDIYVQNWNYGDALNMQNPYWIANRMNRSNNKYRYMINASLRYKVLDWLELAARMRWDDARTKAEDKRYASTTDLFAHSKYGFYGYSNAVDQSLYGDFMANINKSFGDFSLSANLGVSMQRTKYETNGFQGGLKAPSNIFSPNAIDYGSPTNDNRPIYSSNRHHINAAFANVELGWRSMLYLTVTGRNDWDSALDNTDNPSFFYPSVGLSAVITEMAKLPEWVSYLKVRGSYASVGSAISPNITSPWRYTYNPASQSYQTVTYKFPKNFKPERTNSWELGLTGRFFNNDLSLDLTLYQSNTYNQTFLRSLSAGEGYSHEYIQTGNVRNRGIELSLGYRHTWGDFTWNTNLTYSANENKVIELIEDKPEEVISKGGLNNADIILKKGGTMGDVYTKSDFKRDLDGNIVIDNNNVQKITLSNPEYRGSVLPKGNIGFSNDFTWKNFNVGFLLTARLGGIVMSQTQAILDEWGVSENSAIARDNGGIPVSYGNISAESYYSVVGGANPIWSEYIYDGTNVRLQELHVGYTFDKKMLGFATLSLGVTAHNLFMIYNKAPFDPELTASTGTYFQGFDYFMQPSLKSLGFNVRLNF